MACETTSQPRNYPDEMRGLVSHIIGTVLPVVTPKHRTEFFEALRLEQAFGVADQN